MEAKDLFKELEFKILSQDKNLLVYSCEDDYNKVFINFDLKYKRYNITWEKFIDHLYNVVPMAERPKENRHSGYYGHWQNQTNIYINAKMHNAIHQQIVELGWIK